jgi:hypothetical protein
MAINHFIPRRGHATTAHVGTTVVATEPILVSGAAQWRA